MTKFESLYNTWARKTGLKEPITESIIPGGKREELEVFIDAAFKHFGVDPEYIDVSGMDLQKLKGGLLKFADRAKDGRTKDFFRDVARLNSPAAIFHKLLMYMED